MSSCRTTASATRLPIVPYPLTAIRAGMGSALRRTNGGGPKKAVRRPTVRMSRRRPRDPGSSTAGRLAGNAPRIQLPSDPRDHRHEHGGFRESISIESPPREIPDRALFGPDSPNACHTGHCVLDGSTRFHAFDDARRVREPGSVADRDAARLVDDRAVLHVEVVGDQRRPHEPRLDPDSKIAAAEPGLPPGDGSLEGLFPEPLVGDLRSNADRPDARAERERLEDPTGRADLHGVVRPDGDADGLETSTRPIDEARPNPP